MESLEACVSAISRCEWLQTKQQKRCSELPCFQIRHAFPSATVSSGPWVKKKPPRMMFYSFLFLWFCCFISSRAFTAPKSPEDCTKADNCGDCLHSKCCWHSDRCLFYDSPENHCCKDCEKCSTPIGPGGNSVAEVHYHISATIT